MFSFALYDLELQRSPSNQGITVAGAQKPYTADLHSLYFQRLELRLM